jgi:hypothetical protein
MNLLHKREKLFYVYHHTIELIWALNEVASKNITFKLKDVKPLFQEVVEH